MGTAGEPWTFGDGTHAFRLRLTPPLAAVPDLAEVVVTGPSTASASASPRLILHECRVQFQGRVGS